MRWLSLRKTLMTIHLWAGLVLSLPIIVLCATGSFLVLSLADIPGPHGTAHGVYQPLSRIVDAARPMARDGLIPTRITMPISPGDTASVRMSSTHPAFSDDPGMLVYVDPVSLQVKGIRELTSPSPLVGWALALHTIFLLPIGYGRSAVGWTGIALCIISVTGTVLWWPRKGQWQGAFGIKRRARGFRLHRDIHNAFGVWTLVPVFVLSFTGVALTFPSTSRDVMHQLMPSEETFVPPPSFPAKGPLQLDGIAALALASTKNTVVSVVDIPREGQWLSVVTLRDRGIVTGALPIRVQVNAMAGGVLVISDPRNFDGTGRITTWMQIIHFGHRLGMVWTLLAFVSGLIPILLAVTGAYMWWLKRIKRRAMTPLAQTAGR